MKIYKLSKNNISFFSFIVMTLHTLTAVPIIDEKKSFSHHEIISQTFNDPEQTLIKSTQDDELQKTPNTVEDFYSKESQDTDEVAFNSNEQYQTALLSSHDSETQNCSLSTLECFRKNDIRCNAKNEKTDLLQAAPPTKHPIERKSIKAIIGYAAGTTAFCFGISTGCSVATYAGVPLIPAIGIGVVVGLAAGGLTIHYLWDFINTLFTN